MEIKNIFIGQKVRFKGNIVIGECIGIIEKIYPFRPDEENFQSVAMRPDTLPEKWPYLKERTFAPSINELEEI